MLVLILVILFVLWILGYVTPAILSVTLFTLKGHVVSLWDLLLFLVIIWLLGVLPSPFREIFSVAFILWLLSVFGIIAIVGLSNLLVIAIIVGLLLYILRF